MVSAACRLGLIAILVLSGRIPAKEPGDYHEGEIVEADIVTPVALHVVDTAATEALRQQEAARVPLIFRFDPHAADVAELELRNHFATTRSHFQEQIQITFKRRKLDATTLALPRFQEFVAAFQKQNRGFPLNTNLAELWAAGDTGRIVQSAALARLRSMQERLLRPANLTPDAKPGNRALLVTWTNASERLTFDVAEERGTNVAFTDLLSLVRARAELTESFPPEERAAGSFTAGWLRPNCIPEAELTESVRHQRTANLLVADSFQPGQILAQRGQTVDARLKATLDELRDKTAVSELTKRVGEEQARVERIKAQAEKIQLAADESQVLAATAQAGADRIRQRNQWLLAGLAATTAGVGFLAWRLARRRRQPSLLPARVAGHGLPATVVSCPACDETFVIPASTASATDVTWQQRAGAAELRAERAQAALRTGVMSQFGIWIKHQFTQRLLTERTRMLEAQASAADELAELERRLDELHAPLQERLRAYEKRVKELELSLAAKGRENRQLLEAKIQLTRKQIEAERTQTVIERN